VRLLKRLFRIIFPIYNWGVAVALLVLALVPVSIAIFVDAELARFMGIGAYLGIVITYLISGLAPDEMEIRADQIATITTELDAAPLLARNRRPALGAQRPSILVVGIGSSFHRPDAAGQLAAEGAPARPQGDPGRVDPLLESLRRKAPLQIGEQVAGLLQPDRQSQQVRMDAGLGLRFGRHAAVGHGRGDADQGREAAER
jgi:hypothetical protein